MPTIRPLLTVLLAGTLTGGLAAAEATVLVDGKQSVISGSELSLAIDIAAWGDKWKYMGWNGSLEATGDTAASGTFSGDYKGAPAPTTLELQVSQTGPRELRYRYRFASEQAQDYTMIAIAIDPGKRWQGSVTGTTTGGETIAKDWPVGRDGLGDDISEIVFEGAAGRTAIRFEPALDVASDGQLRAVVGKRLEAGTPVEVAMHVTLPQDAAFYPGVAAVPDEPGKEHWFEWKPDHDVSGESVLSMADWITGPAGSRGRVTRTEGDLRYGDEPFTVWGLNLCFNDCFPERELADRRADFYAKYGINAVRLHKYGERILVDGSSTEYDPEKLDRMDYFVAALKERGIFVKLSPTFGSMMIAADAYERIPYATDWGERPSGRKRVETKAGAVFLSRELQDLHIEQMTNLLEHENPYTGMTYAEDPVVMLVEAVNEESMLFYGTLKQLQRSQTLRERAGTAFHDWLIARYGSPEAVVERWGEGMVGNFKAERLHQEGFDQGVLHPVGDPWFWSPENITGSQQHRAARLYDTALFFYEQQNAFYDRYLEAVRATGYDGLFMASNWQAGSASSHFYNLHTDARFDVVDRHNYFGGKKATGSMLSVPGGGSLSSGMQQVAGVPFSLSEWIHVFPNQWGGEGPAIIGAYGLGLQGWDISFMFQNDDNGSFSRELSPGRWDIWDVTAPQVMGTFPAIARQVRRGDVSESDVVARLNVHIDSLHRGEIGFRDLTEQIYDIKVFTTDRVPAQTLAVARTEVTYVDEPTETETFDLEAHRDEAGALVSTTGELRWMPGEDDESGWFSIDTAATQAVVGFAGGSRHQLGNVVIEPESRYGLIYVTAASKDGTLTDDDRLIVLASARAHNTGMKYLDGQLLAKGKGPVLMEPVVAEITIDRPGASVHVLDQDGRRTGETLPVTDGRFTIDGRETRTIYYEIAFE